MYKSVVSKTAYNLVKHKANEMTEMIIDDLLIEMVDILNRLEAEEEEAKEETRQKGLLQDMLEQLVDYETTTNQMLNHFHWHRQH